MSTDEEETRKRWTSRNVFCVRVVKRIFGWNTNILNVSGTRGQTTISPIKLGLSLSNPSCWPAPAQRNIRGQTTISLIKLGLSLSNPSCWPAPAQRDPKRPAQPLPLRRRQLRPTGTHRSHVCRYGKRLTRRSAMSLSRLLRRLANLHTPAGNWMSRVKEDRPRQDGKRQDVGRSLKNPLRRVFCCLCSGGNPFGPPPAASRPSMTVLPTQKAGPQAHQ